MYVERKSLAVEEGRSKSINLWTGGGSEKLTLRKGESISNTSKNFKSITHKVRRDSMMALGARGDRAKSQRLLSRCSTESKIPTKDNLQDANDDLVKREGELTHSLSRTQIELEWTQVMLQEAVGFGEQLKGKIRHLNKKLAEQVDLNSLLEKQVHFHIEANNILTSTLEEARKNSMATRNELNKANKSMKLMKIELDQEKAHNNRVQVDYIAAQKDFDSDLKSGIEALAKRLEVEKAKLVVSLEETAAAKKEWREAEERLSLANSKLAVLGRQLVQKEIDYNKMVSALIAEKGTLQTENYALAREINNAEDLLKDINEKLLYYQRKSVFLDSSVGDVTTLADEITMIKQWTQRSSTTDFSSFISNQECGSHPGRLASQIIMEHIEEPQIPEIIQSYLHITAMAVQLHFPDIKDVSTDMLIENVISSPFYLYYDLMMMFMRKTKHGLAKEDAHLEAETNLKSASEQSNFLTRFFTQKRGNDIAVGSKHINSVKSLVAIHPPMSRLEKHQNSQSLINVARKCRSKEVSL